MHVPPYLTDHAPLNDLYHGLVSALAPTLFGPHAEQLAFRAVLHATAWLSENNELEPPYHATETQGSLLYHCAHSREAVPALAAHIAALLDGPDLTRAGTAVWTDLNDSTDTSQRRPKTTDSCGSSLWRNHLQLLTRYGLNFDQRLRIAHDAA